MAKYYELLKDPRWQKRRLLILERDNWMCQYCGSTEKTLNVHHLKYQGLPWSVDDKFLITFCEEHHKVEEFIAKNNPYLKIAAQLTGVPCLYQIELLRRSLAEGDRVYQKHIIDSVEANFLKRVHG